MIELVDRNVVALDSGSSQSSSTATKQLLNTLYVQS
jgi:hypothetical protein